MDQSDRENSLTSRVRTLQIITIALVGGVVIFAAVSWFLVGGGQPQEAGLLKYLGLAFALMTLMPFMLVPQFISIPQIAALETHQATSGPSFDDALLTVYQTRLIVRLALLEGAAFFNVVAYFMEHAVWSLGITGALVIVMLTLIPTRTRVEHWLEAERLSMRK